MKPPQPVLSGASKAIKSIFASPYVATALCLAGALAAFLVYPAYAQSGDETSTPSNLTAAIADGGVILNWSSPVQDAASVTGYEILRRRPKEGENNLLVLVADTGSTATTYADATANEPGGSATSTGSRRFAAARGAPGPTSPASTCPRQPMRRSRRRLPRPETAPKRRHVQTKRRRQRQWT